MHSSIVEDVYRFVRYRVQQVCRGTDLGKEIIVAHYNPLETAIAEGRAGDVFTLHIGRVAKPLKYADEWPRPSGQPSLEMSEAITGPGVGILGALALEGRSAPCDRGS